MVAVETAVADAAAAGMFSSNRATDGRPESRAASNIRSSILQAGPKRNKHINFAICGQCMSRDSPLCEYLSMQGLSLFFSDPFTRSSSGWIYYALRLYPLAKLSSQSIHSIK